MCPLCPNQSKPKCCFLILQSANISKAEVADYFSVILQKLESMDERLNQVEKQLDDQKYYAIIGDGINRFRKVVAKELGYKTWTRLAEELEAEEDEDSRPVKQTIKLYLEKHNVDNTVWDSLWSIAGDRNLLSHQGDKCTSTWLYNYSKTTKPPSTVSAYQADLVSAMALLKQKRHGL